MKSKFPKKFIGLLSIRFPYVHWQWNKNTTMICVLIPCLTHTLISYARGEVEKVGVTNWIYFNWDKWMCFVLFPPSCRQYKCHNRCNWQLSNIFRNQVNVVLQTYSVLLQIQLLSRFGRFLSAWLLVNLELTVEIN